MRIGRVLTEATGTLYRASAEPRLWTEALTEVARALESQVVQLLLWNERTQTPILSLISAGAEREGEDYIAHFAAVDPHHEDRARLPLGRLGTNESFLASGAAEKSEFYQDFYQRRGYCHMLSGRLHVSGDVVIAAGLHRTDGQRRWTSADVVRAQRLITHFQNAVRIEMKMDQLRAGSAVGAAAAEAAPFGVVVINSAGQIIFINREARRIVDRGAVLRIVDGKLAAVRASDDATLQKLVSRAVDRNMPSGDLGMSLARPDSPRGYAIVVAPLAAELTLFGVPESSAALFISDPERQRRIPAERLRSLWRLTRVEASVALDLAAGLSVKEIAETRQIAEQTVRIHLSAIFRKTGARRQVELLRVLAAAEAPLMPKE